MMMIPKIPTLPPKPSKFKPGPFDVICARGKQAYNHDGNKHFRGIVSNATEKYSKVESKLQRSMIVTDIVDAIRGKGGFLRMNDTTGEWIECSDVLCREKVGQYFRSALGCRFKSRSTKKSKQINEQGGRQQRRKRTDCIPLRLVHSLSVIVFSNKLVETIMERLSIDIIFIPESSEDAFYEMAITANMELLNIIKEDKKLVNQFCVEQQSQEEGEESVSVAAAKTLSDRNSSSSSIRSCSGSTSRKESKNCRNARAA